MLSSHELLGFMSPALATDILNWAYETEKPLYKAVLQAVAEARRVRPVFLQHQPCAQRHVTMLATLTRPALDLVAASLLRSWLVTKHKSMLVDFLTALEIKHDAGVVEELPPAVDDAKLKIAVDTLLAKYPAELVT